MARTTSALSAPAPMLVLRRASSAINTMAVWLSQCPSMTAYKRLCCPLAHFELVDRKTDPINCGRFPIFSATTKIPAHDKRLTNPHTATVRIIVAFVTCRDKMEHTFHQLATTMLMIFRITGPTLKESHTVRFLTTYYVISIPQIPPQMALGHYISRRTPRGFNDFLIHQRG